MAEGENYCFPWRLFFLRQDSTYPRLNFHQQILEFHQSFITVWLREPSDQMSLGSSPPSLRRDPPITPRERHNSQGKREITFRLAQKTKRPTLSKSLSPRTEWPFITDNGYQLRKEAASAQVLPSPTVWWSWTDRTATTLTHVLARALWNALPAVDMPSVWERLPPLASANSI